MIRYYEQMLEQRDWTKNIIEEHFRRFSDFIIDDFDDYQFGSRGIPADFLKLKTNKRFWSLVKRAKMFCEVTSAQMSDRKKIATGFLDQVTKEIKKNK
jgi:hypothetical protein